MGEQTLRSFATDDFLALDALHREQPLSPALKERLPGLISVGAVESVESGRGTRYILSAAFHAALGASGHAHTQEGLGPRDQ
nr:hypothetical protein [uncultured Rhodoferax sp.]